ncbi:unnamed protein product [Rotaria magnacalcarata]|uniref:Uncharacterized protein n=1 Tax=Rotaria magnacalcarata TaxID=392030 RepID=A0A820XW27_9BILA|nr:unnamed protein product [Rotaria magnacalcarata]CAF2121819.1 unnamed protein product [Rotaria magnacalcarata]CAF2148980.1 unnamed protein product [Rotaria magnacalcarata]CAF3924349.1 unnamed protein product [Rotaria magnacalcarata]CAF4538790.1 unnamed protein product [Rotaria magnacalcarata]
MNQVQILFFHTTVQQNQIDGTFGMMIDTRIFIPIPPVIPMTRGGASAAGHNQPEVIIEDSDSIDETGAEVGETMNAHNENDLNDSIVCLDDDECLCLTDV